MWQIGEVTQNLGINPQTVYFYERTGLIPPLQRTEGGYRVFNQEDVDRLVLIQRAKSLGLTLAEIREILLLKQGRSLSCQAMYDLLERKITQIEEKISNLQALKHDLQPLLEECRRNLNHPNPEHQCRVIEPKNKLT